MPFPTLTQSIDELNYADQDPHVGGAPSPAVWTGPIRATQAQNRLVSNIIRRNASAAGQSYLNLTDFEHFGPDVEILARVGIKPGSGQALNHAFRINSPGTAGWDGYSGSSRAQAGTDQYEQYSITNNSFTQIFTPTVTGPEFAVGDWIGGQAWGNTINFYIIQNGVVTQVITGINTSFFYKGYSGLWIDDTVGGFAGPIYIGTIPAYRSFGTPGITNFVGADENPVSEGGRFANAPIHPSGGRLQRLNNILVPDGSFTGTAYIDTVYPADQEAWFQVNGKGATNDHVGLHLRITNPNTASETWYELACQVEAGTDSWKIYKNVAGAGSTLIATLTAQEYALGDYIGFRAIGPTLTALYIPTGSLDVAVVGSTTDTDIAGGGYIGIGMSTGTGKGIELFGGGSYLQSVANPKIQQLVAPMRYV